MARNIKLQTLRISHEPKLTQRDVADGSGLSQTRYWQIENGQAPSPSAAEQNAIAKALGVDVAEVFPARDAAESEDQHAGQEGARRAS